MRFNDQNEEIAYDDDCEKKCLHCEAQRPCFSLNRAGWFVVSPGEMSVLFVFCGREDKYSGSERISDELCFLTTFSFSFEHRMRLK